jgi:DNA-directed RNA polymerase subunit RPC12/RpoP
MMIKELKIEKKEVKCKHCRKLSSEVLVCEWLSSFSTHYIYFCINCNKQIGISRRERGKEPSYSR